MEKTTTPSATDINGVCYTCGGYIASRDAGRYI